VPLHHIALHGMTFGVMSQTYGCDHTGTTLFVDAASYLVVLLEYHASCIVYLLLIPLCACFKVYVVEIFYLGIL
jgi:hypothetical protein